MSVPTAVSRATTKPAQSSLRKSAALAAAKTTPPLKPKKVSIFLVAIWLSILAHALLLSMQFKAELKKKFSDHLPVLEVMLVNAKTESKPDNAETFAQANLDRGGNTDENRKMKSALPSVKQLNQELTPKPAAEKKAGAATPAAVETPEQQRVAELEKQALALMTQLKSSQKVASAPNQAAAPKSLNLQNMTAAAVEMDRLEALISKQQDDYQKRPKRKFVGARAKEYRYAMYVDAWRQKVERIGNLNYPEAAKNLQLHGQLQMTVSIRADGSIESIELNRSSGHKVLDQAARHIVELAAPYARFPDDVSAEIDILSITRTWTFSKEDSLATDQ
jgi:protein TonB